MDATEIAAWLYGHISEDKAEYKITILKSRKPDNPCKVYCNYQLPPKSENPFKLETTKRH